MPGLLLDASALYPAAREPQRYLDLLEDAAVLDPHPLRGG